MTDVERFFRRLVSNLAATDPARLRRPVPLDDITGFILPYRTNRRVLQLETVEDYEAVLLRLCAGEGNLVRTEPEEARGRFAQESRSANPDLAVLHSFEDVQVTLRAEPLAWALAPEPDDAYAPPAQGTGPALEPAPEAASASIRRPGRPESGRAARRRGAARGHRHRGARPKRSDLAEARRGRRGGNPAVLHLLRRLASRSPTRQLLPPLRSEPDPDPLSRVPQRGRAGMEALRQLRRGRR